MKMILTHPANKRFIEQLQMSSGLDSGLSWMSLRFDSHIPRFGPCKKIKLQNGLVIERENFTLRCGVVTYGPEDLTWLMWAGVIAEQFEPLFYIMDEPMRFFTNFKSFSPLQSPRMLIASAAV